MVATAPVTLALVLVVLGTGAVVGLAAGWLYARLLRQFSRHLAVDALLGAATFLAVQFVAGTLDLQSTYRDGRVIGLRGVMLNHVLGWRICVTLVLVALHHFVRRTRSASPEARARTLR